MLVVQSKVREQVKKRGANMAGDFADELSKRVEEYVDDAIKRARSNGRKTVRPNDL
jgi:histone H3/H4